MNLRRYVQVLRRFKVLVVAGLIAAMSLSLLSLAHVKFDGATPRFEYRSEERWGSRAMLFVTQDGFPWGRSVLDEVIPVRPEGDAGYVPRYSDVNRFQTLAQLYAQLAMGDAVRALVLRNGPLEGEYDAAPVNSRDGSTFLPLIGITGFGSTPARAERTARRVSEAFVVYLRRMQETNKIPPERRVDIQVIERPGNAVLIEGRRLTRPIFLFVLLMSATVALVFALENIRPQARAETPVGPTPVVHAERKSA
jgi:hypothetical protein